jgi:hypothetical protein
MLHVRLHPIAFLVMLAAFFAISGCGEPDTAPKLDLTEKEKQQVRELNEQRAQEWGPPKRK